MDSELSNGSVSAAAPMPSLPPSQLQRAIMAVGGRLPANWLGRRIAAVLRSRLRRSSKGPVDVERFGFKIRLSFGNNACERRLMVTPQFFEPDVVAALDARVRQGCHFVDVGANVGIYSLFVAHRAAPGAKILSIEPQPELCARLAENIKLNAYDISIAPNAVSDVDGEVSMAIDKKNLGASTVEGDGGDETITVRCRKLYDVVNEHGFERVDVMKLDIEGHEERVLRSFLEDAPPALWPGLLIVEMHATPENEVLIADLTGSGWKVISSSPDCCILERGQNP